MNSPSSPLSGHIVPVTAVRQKYTNWCWAACCEMFAKHHGFTQYDQYQFVLLVLGGRPPDSDPRDSKSKYNEAAGPGDFLKVLRQGLPTAKQVGYVDPSGPAPPRFPEVAITKFINENRIMIYGSGNHARVLCGYRFIGDKQSLVAVDPEAGGSVAVTWEDFNGCAWVVYVPKS
jgi:hypothetical protein